MNIKKRRRQINLRINIMTLLLMLSMGVLLKEDNLNTNTITKTVYCNNITSSKLIARSNDAVVCTGSSIQSEDNQGVQVLDNFNNTDKEIIKRYGRPVYNGVDLLMKDEKIKGMNLLLLKSKISDTPNDNIYLTIYKAMDKYVKTEETIKRVDNESIMVYDIIDSTKSISTLIRGDEVELYCKIGDFFITNKGLLKSDAKLYSQKEYDKLMLERQDVVISNIVTVKSGITLAKLETLTRGTMLEGTAQAFYDLEQRTGINAIFAYSVAVLESGNGTSQIAKYKNNLFGLNAVDGDSFDKAFSFASKASSIECFGRIITKYISDGRRDLNSINPIYCSSDAWKNKVMTIMEETAIKLNNNKIK